MKLAVKSRDITGKKVKSLRRQGLVPAIVYGKHIDQPVKISCVKNDLLKVYKASGYTTPVELMGDLDQLVLIHTLQLDPISDEIITADFLAVSRKEKVTANIPLVRVGESEIEKLNEWRIQIIKDTVEVQALPQDLPHSIEIDISNINAIDDVIFVKDLKIPAKVEVIDDLELPVVTVMVIEDEAPEEEAATEEAPAAEAPAEAGTPEKTE